LGLKFYEKSKNPQVFANRKIFIKHWPINVTFDWIKPLQKLRLYENVLHETFEKKDRKVLKSMTSL